MVKRNNTDWLYHLKKTGKKTYDDILDFTQFNVTMGHKKLQAQTAHVIMRELLTVKLNKNYLLTQRCNDHLSISPYSRHTVCEKH